MSRGMHVRTHACDAQVLDPFCGGGTSVGVAHCIIVTPATAAATAPPNAALGLDLVAPAITRPITCGSSCGKDDRDISPCHRDRGSGLAGWLAGRCLAAVGPLGDGCRSWFSPTRVHGAASKIHAAARKANALLNCACMATGRENCGHVFDHHSLATSYDGTIYL